VTILFNGFFAIQTKCESAWFFAHLSSASDRRFMLFWMRDHRDMPVLASVDHTSRVEYGWSFSLILYRACVLASAIPTSRASDGRTRLELMLKYG